MSGHVFHPGHEPLHGITVVVECVDRRTMVGRFHHTDQRGVHLLDVAMHRPDDGDGPREAFLERTQKFGVKAEHPHVLVPEHEVVSVTPLREALQQ